jgi:hypothetical protein
LGDAYEFAFIGRHFLRAYDGGRTTESVADLWIIGGQEIDDATPVLILPVRLENGLCASFQDRQITFFQSFGSKLGIQTIHRTLVPWYSLAVFTGHYGATDAL